jgi:hypothetical protein
MRTFQTVVLAAGNSNFAESGIAASKIQAQISPEKGSLLETCLAELRDSSRIVCAVNPDDLDFAHKVTSHNKNVILKSIERPTRGALITLAMCLGELDPKLPIVVTSVDGIVPGIVSDFSQFIAESAFDGGAIVIESTNPQLSYVTALSGTPIEFVEKKVVSNIATTGIFCFSNLQLLEEAIEWVLLSNNSLNGNFYISSALNRLIYDNRKLGLYQVDAFQYFRFSTPEEYFLSKSEYTR